MSGFCPDGYVSVPAAIARAMQYWFADRLAAVETAVPDSPVKGEPNSTVDALALALSQPSIPDALRHKLADVVTQAVDQLRRHLHHGKATAYYFGDDGRQAVKPDFWATPTADGILESGSYFPFGRPSRWYEQRPNYPLFLLQKELNALLSEPKAAAKLTTVAKKAERAELLKVFLREHRDLTRKEQRDLASQQWPNQFTDVEWRKALRADGRRNPGPQRPK
jgi:hypothetical protein